MAERKKGGTPKGVKAMRVDLTEDQIKLCERYGTVGLNNDQLAGIFGVSPATFDEILKRQPEVAQAIKRGRGNGIGKIAGTLFQKAAAGNITAAIFYLKTQGRWVEARDDVPSDPEVYETLNSLNV